MRRSSIVLALTVAWMSMSTAFISGVWNFMSRSSALTLSAGRSCSMSTSMSESSRGRPLLSARIMVFTSPLRGSAQMSWRGLLPSGPTCGRGVMYWIEWFLRISFSGFSLLGIPFLPLLRRPLPSPFFRPIFIRCNKK